MKFDLKKHEESYSSPSIVNPEVFQSSNVWSTADKWADISVSFENILSIVVTSRAP